MAEGAGTVSLPDELDTRRLGRRALQIGGVLAAICLAAWLAPGLGSVRERLSHAAPAWIGLAVGLELLSCLSYVVMFRPVFCTRMRWRTSSEIALSELGVGSLVPAGGAGGLALGVWALRRGGMPGQDIATRTVAFFVLKSAVNFVAVVVVGAVLAVGLAGPSLSPLLTALPAALAAAAIAATLALPRLLGRRGERQSPEPESGARRLAARAGDALGDGVREAARLVRSRNPALLLGAVGYWAFDNAVLWACFHAFGAAPPVTVILMGYLIGQLGGLLPLPGGLGGVEGGLLGTLVAYGAPLDAAAVAIVAYRVVQFWVPLVLAVPAFASLQHGLNQPDRPDLCDFAPIPAG